MKLRWLAIIILLCIPAVSAFSSTSDSLSTSAKEKRDYLFAIKSNLLFDVATAVNVELEIPIGKHFSIAGEWIFPDWVDRRTNTYCLQSNIKSLEARLWLGRRGNRRVLTGHFLGIYGQKGDFDFQPFTDYGYQCSEMWAAGLSYGFAHTINRAKTLSLEYSIGIGYSDVTYCKYHRNSDGSKLISYPDWYHHDIFAPIPTKAKISLCWLIPINSKKGEKVR